MLYTGHFLHLGRQFLTLPNAFDLLPSTYNDIHVSCRLSKYDHQGMPPRVLALDQLDVTNNMRSPNQCIDCYESIVKERRRHSSQ